VDFWARKSTMWRSWRGLDAADAEFSRILSLERFLRYAAKAATQDERCFF
jgi:hypothetical protein